MVLVEVVTIKTSGVGRNGKWVDVKKKAENSTTNECVNGIENVEGRHECANLKRKVMSNEGEEMIIKSTRRLHSLSNSDSLPSSGFQTSPF
jgi:hypothetical protein